MTRCTHDCFWKSLACCPDDPEGMGSIAYPQKLESAATEVWDSIKESLQWRLQLLQALQQACVCMHDAPSRLHALLLFARSLDDTAATIQGCVFAAQNNLSSPPKPGMGLTPRLTRSATAPEAAVVTRAASLREIGCKGPAAQHAPFCLHCLQAHCSKLRAVSCKAALVHECCRPSLLSDRQKLLEFVGDDGGPRRD